MNILYFASVDFYQKPNPSFHLMHSMITDLLENGDKINFVGCAMEGVVRHIPIEFENNPNFRYRLIKLPSTKKSRFVKRYIDGIEYALSAKKHIREMLSDSDIVFIQSSPTALYNIVIVYSLTKGNKRILYNVQDMFPGSSIASGVMTQKWMQDFFYSLQKIAYKKSDIMMLAVAVTFTFVWFMESTFCKNESLLCTVVLLMFFGTWYDLMGGQIKKTDNGGI